MDIEGGADAYIVPMQAQPANLAPLTATDEEIEAVLEKDPSYNRSAKKVPARAEVVKTAI